jgi:hypothetical protein
MKTNRMRGTGRPLAVAGGLLLALVLPGFLLAGPTPQSQGSSTIIGSEPQATVQQMMALGTVWEVAECCGWSGKWTRRPGTNVFDARWTGPNGVGATDTITLKSWGLRSNKVVLARTKNQGTYTGTVSPEAGQVTGGTASWYPAGAEWSARFEPLRDDKGPVTLPRRR